MIFRCIAITLLTRTFCQVDIYPTQYVTNNNIGVCDLAEVLSIDPTRCQNPRDVAFDYGTGALYVACVGPNKPGLMRYITRFPALL